MANILPDIRAWRLVAVYAAACGIVGGFLMGLAVGVSIARHL